MSRSPHLADHTAGIGTLPAYRQVGCRASTGRFPPPLWMRADMSAHLKLYMCWLLTYLEYNEKRGRVSRNYHVPDSQEFKYFSCSDDNVSIRIPMAWSLSRAISLSSAAG